MLLLDPESRDTVKKIIMKIDRTYPELKPASVTKSTKKDPKIEEMERKMKEMEARMQ